MSFAMPPVAILAGGLATRLRPLTETVPKAMIPILGRPFIDHQLRLLRREGVGDVVLLVGYLGEQIRDFVGDGARYGIRVRYAFDGPTLLGTGGAVRNAAPLLGRHFLIMYGDSYLDVPMAPIVAAFEARGKPALMTVLRNQGRWDRSNALLRADGSVLYDKSAPTPEMVWIDFGLSVVEAALLLRYPAGEKFDLAALFEEISVAGDLAGFEVHNRFFEVGSVSGIAETETYLKKHGVA